MRPAFVVLATMVACGRDPILQKAEEDAAAKKATTEAAPMSPGVPTPPPPGGTQTTGVAGSPAPGVPAEPPPGVPTEPPPGNPFEGAGDGAGGLDVTGTIEFSGFKAGPIRITAFDGDHSAGAGGHPKVVAFGSVDKPGPFTLKVPANTGNIWIEATIDEDGDGRPGPLDPAGLADKSPVKIGAAPVSGLRIVVARHEPPPKPKGG
ncbi:MAG: hypothetical protein ACOZNI_21690 [Myxococcota bacterium]